MACPWWTDVWLDMKVQCARNSNVISISCDEEQDRAESLIFVTLKSVGPADYVEVQGTTIKDLSELPQTIFPFNRRHLSRIISQESAAFIANPQRTRGWKDRFKLPLFTFAQGEALEGFSYLCVVFVYIIRS